MFESLFSFLKVLDEIFWGYLAFSMIIILGLFLTIKHGFFQIRRLPVIGKTFLELFRNEGGNGERGVHPLRVFFASVGGMIGIGNICGVTTAVQLGGPGALLWLWIAGAIGSIVKYGEIYLGLKYRVPNEKGGWDGGPMYFLQKAFKSRLFPILVSLFLCVYGVEIYQFSVITDSVSTNWHINRFLVMLVLLAAVLYTSLGGVKRIGRICSFLMPLFVVGYMSMALWVLFCQRGELLGIFGEVFTSAFTGHAAVGGFAGSSIIMAIQHGTARAAYAADIGVGKDAIIQSETSNPSPARQARIAVFGVFIDNLICSCSILLVLATGLWKASPPLASSELVRTALSHYFPLMNLFIPLFFTIVGYTVTVSYFAVGLKCSKFLHPKRGPIIYLIYGILAFGACSFFEQTQTLLIMSLSGAALLIINLLGIFILRKEILFEETPAMTFTSETAQQ